MPSSDFLLANVLRNLTETTLYERGVLDVLRVLGLVTVENGQATPTGDVARLIISRLAQAADGDPIAFDWNDLDRSDLRGVDILRAWEAGHVESAARRSVCVAQAVIKARRSNVDYYLMQFDAHARHYQPIGGKVDNTDADSAAALRREIMEELELAAPLSDHDCQLTLLKSGWHTSKISPTFGVMTDYTFDFYHVTAIRFPITQTGYTRWLRRGEIERARADDSRPVSAIFLEALGMDVLDSLDAGAEF